MQAQAGKQDTRTQQQHETSGIDHILRYIYDYRNVMDWLQQKHPDVLQELKAVGVVKE